MTSIIHQQDAMVSAMGLLSRRLHELVASDEPITMHLKPDGSKVTSADIELNQMFNDYITEACPSDAVRGEELSTSEEFDLNSTTQGLWVIDPIDGTNGFWRDYGNRHFKSSNTTIQLAWFAPGEKAPTLSMVRAPLNEMQPELLAVPSGVYYGSASHDVRKRVVTPHGPRALQDVARYDKNFWEGVDLAYDSIEDFFPYARRINHPLGYAAVALGDCDLGMFPGTHPHDIAPNAHIVHQAGGVVRTLAGESYDDVDWRVEPTAGVLVTGNDALADAFLDKLHEKIH